MRAWLLALAACGAAPTVIGNRASSTPAIATRARPASDLRYAGCDETGCPLQLRDALRDTLPVDPQFAVRPPLGLPIELPADRDLEAEVAAQHRKLLVIGRFEY